MWHHHVVHVDFNEVIDRAGTAAVAAESYREFLLGDVPDDELPPVRVLAEQLLINPNTVVRAYRELEVAGLIYKRRGAGTYVSDGATPYTDDECRRLMAERLDAVLVEGRHLGYGTEKLIALLRERGAALPGEDTEGGG